jgi:hypothetical protein
MTAVNNSPLTIRKPLRVKQKKCKEQKSVSVKGKGSRGWILIMPKEAMKESVTLCILLHYFLK